MSNTPILSIEGLRRRYGDQTAVDNLSFHAWRGQCLGPLDPNGAGKTTTLRMLLGMTMSDTGSLRLCDESVPEAVHRARMCVGAVPQSDSLDPDFFISENLRISRRYSGLSAATIRERIPILLEFVRFEQEAGAPVCTLLGGMKQQLIVVRALTNDPDILVVDEPTISFGSQTRYLVWECPRSLLAAGKTILLTTYFTEEAERLYGELCVIDNGREIAQDKPQELITREIGCGMVEIYGDDLNALRTLLTSLADRTEVGGETLFCYVRDP